MLDDLVVDFAVESERSERNLDEDVLSEGTVSLFKFNPLNGAEEHKSGVALELRVGLLELDEGLGSFFFEFGNLGL